MRRAVLVVAGFLALVIPLSAASFGTINGLGQRAEHERITRAALHGFGIGPRTMDMIAGRRGSFGAVGSPDNPIRGNMTNQIYHCDAGDHLDVAGYTQPENEARHNLTGCRNTIFMFLEHAVEQAGRLVDEQGVIDERQAPRSCRFDGRDAPAKCETLDRLGYAFHAAQDFYSHSNWTDAVTGEITLRNPPGLGNTGRAPWLDPRRRDEPFPPGLITGCFEGLPERMFCVDGHGTERIRHADLNKDTGPIDITNLANPRIGVGTTPRGRHGGNFERAVRAAIDDTADKWAFFESEIIRTYGEGRGRRILCVIRSDTVAACR